ncbi:MAG: tetratricopeptide repeat protein [Acidobacteria bacterium]|nr:tetratricopeptide repeat protein [Acidobacteriota bacterium]
MMNTRIGLTIATLILSAASFAFAQSGATRPRRVNPSQPTPAPTPASRNVASPATNATPVPARSTRPAGGNPGMATSNSAATGSTAHAFSLYQQKQYDAAAKEAKQIAASDPKNSEAWKVAGFAEFALRQYDAAAVDLQRALDLQRAAGENDPNTVDALAQAYVLMQKFDAALPLLVSATGRAGATPDAVMLYYRGLAEFNTGKAADAERSFNAAVKADPKNATSLFYLGRIAFERKDFAGAINFLNRATLGDANLSQAWKLLTYAYLQRAAAATGPKADADYLAAVRASDSLVHLRADEESLSLSGQALIRARQYVRAAAVLERAAAADTVQGQTLYLLGFAYTNAKNYPKAISTLERAATKTPNDAEVFRALGYAYEVSKQYAKALAAYEKGVQLAPADADLKESAERVRPFAK